jgi:hypothetical protein
MEKYDNNMDLLNSKLMDIDISEGFSNISASKSTEQVTGCKKPLALNPLTSILTGGVSNLTYKKKKKEYEECLANFKRKQEEIDNQRKQAQVELQKTRDELAKKDAEISIQAAKSNVRTASSDTSDDDKILGLPKVAFWIGVGVLVLGGGFATYKIIKNRKK